MQTGACRGPEWSGIAPGIACATCAALGGLWIYVKGRSPKVGIRLAAYWKLKITRSSNAAMRSCAGRHLAMQAKSFDDFGPEVWEEGDRLASENWAANTFDGAPAMVVQRKYERDIDLLLAEEFSISPAFANWFLKHTSNIDHTNATVADVAVSASDAAGESDLVIIYNVAGGRTFALLIEDKIDAGFQKNQF
jgi:hypothetical protein